MKKFFRWIFGFALAAALATSFCLTACQGEKTEQNGIVITRAEPPFYTEENVAAMQENIYSLLSFFVRAQTNLQELPQATQLKLRNYASGACAEIEEVQLTAAQFISLANLLATEEFSQAFAALSLSSLAPLLGEAARAVGFNNAGKIGYRLVLYAYDLSYRQSLDRYEQYGYTYLILQAEETAAEKNLFESEIGEDNFLTAMQTLCALGALAEGGMQEGFALLLNDGEVLTLLQAQDCLSLNLSNEGWRLLFSYLLKTDKESYAAELLACAQENGDINIIASHMNALFALFRSIQQKLTKEQAALLRQGQYEAFLKSAFAAFDADDWALFEEITDLSLSEDYNQIAALRFGDNYAAYLNGATGCSLARLKAAAETEEFINVLEEYMAGVCPAVAYGLFR